MINSQMLFFHSCFIRREQKTLFSASSLFRPRRFTLCERRGFFVSAADPGLFIRRYGRRSGSSLRDLIPACVANRG